MAKAKRKTKAQKIQRRNQAAQAQPVVAETQVAAPAAAAPVAAPAVKLSTLDAARISHVSSDVRRIGIMTVVFIVVLFALSFVMNHTDFGTSIYDSIHVGS